MLSRPWLRSLARLRAPSATLPPPVSSTRRRAAGLDSRSEGRAHRVDELLQMENQPLGARRAPQSWASPCFKRKSEASRYMSLATGSGIACHSVPQPLCRLRGSRLLRGQGQPASGRGACPGLDGGSPTYFAVSSEVVVMARTGSAIDRSQTVRSAATRPVSPDGMTVWSGLAFTSRRSRPATGRWPASGPADHRWTRRRPPCRAAAAIAASAAGPEPVPAAEGVHLALQPGRPHAQRRVGRGRVRWRAALGRADAGPMRIDGIARGPW